MADPYRKNNRWYVRYKDANGKWRDKATNARTKTEARRLAVELEQKFERQRLGLEARRDAVPWSELGELMQWWLDTYSVHTASHKGNVASVEKHFIDSKLGTVSLMQLTAGTLEEYLQSLVDKLEPQTLNNLRSFVHRAFEAARQSGKWQRENPAAGVKKRKVPKKLPDVLKAEEVKPLLAMLAPEHRTFFATALYAGLRKGELCGLQKRDVDLKQRKLSVHRSYDRETTKGGHADVVPIAEELVPFLEHALAADHSDWLFPDEHGEMRTEHYAVHKILRHALARAGLVRGWRHVCRRKGCGYKEEASDQELRRCLNCAMKLWPRARVRKIRFHDLRHTTASLLLMAGADLHAVQKILRHSDPRLTVETYGHLLPGYLQDEVNKLHLGLERDGFAASLLLGSRKRKPVVGRTGKNGQRSRTVEMAPPARIELATFGLGSESEGLAPGSSALQATEILPEAASADSNSLQAVAGLAKDFAARLLLTVREVSRLLRVSTRIVYRMVEQGELEHVRVSNSIRVPVRALEAVVVFGTT